MKYPCASKFLIISLTLVASWRLIHAAPAPRALPPATEKQIRALLAHPQLRDAHVGISIIALGTVPDANAFPARPYDDKQQPVLFAVDAEKRFMPASNVKLYTAALALRVLGPEKTFSTEVHITGDLSEGTLQGTLSLFGNGDPSLSTEDLRSLARQVAARGIKRITGGVFAQNCCIWADNFAGRYPEGWTLDDAIWYYGPEISALAINRNQLDITIEGAAQPGQPAKVTISPPVEHFPISAKVTTGGHELARKSTEEILHFDRSGVDGPISERLNIWGQVAPGQKITEGVAVPDPSRWAGALLKQALEENGVAVGTGLTGPRDMTPLNAAPPGTTPRNANSPGGRRVRHDSPPLRILLRHLLKNSDNLYAEMLWRNADVYSGNPSKIGTPVRGHEPLLSWLRENGVPTDSLRFTDGSGLSRYNLVTPAATARLLAAIERIPGSTAIWDGLPIAGVDGTLKNRMKSTAAAANVRAKTGTFSIVSTLSGYVTTRDGHRLAISLLTNFARDGAAVRR
ncbi:MAG TPA: D-alanyl-D-alanine carboxypeptidase/D-alanyl-D-alanine-endopeptidase, partial [Abditibacteriaceae bacterium]|nr:D-alanyl-D-alanine carboxypeptidase/D-alanyl-D-alanine-endopeptidase [Abditibacteriaceae bacterium]